MESDVIAPESGIDETEGGLFQSQEEVEREGIQPAEQVLPPQAQVKAKRYACKYCAAKGVETTFATSLEVGRHVTKEHKEELRAKRVEATRTTMKAEVEQEVADTEAQVWADIRIRGPEALAVVLQKRLVELLASPGVAPESRTYAIKEWEGSPETHFDFRALARMLISDAGVKPERATRIVEKLEQVYMKYAPALQQGGYQTPYIPSSAAPPQVYGSGGYYQSGYYQPPQPQPGYYPTDPRQQPPYYQAQGWGQPPSPWQQPGPYPPYYQRSLTMEDVDRAVEKAVDRLGEKLRPEAREPQQDMVEVDMPVGYDEDTGKAITQKVRAPASMLPWLMLNNRREKAPVAPKVDETLEKLQETVVGPLEERVKAAEDEARKAREENNAARVAAAEEKATEMKAELAETRKYVDEVNRRLDDDRSNRNVEGYRSDSFKLVGTGLQEVAKMVKERRPAHEILDKLFPTQGAPPAPSQAPPLSMVASETQEAAKAGLIVAKDA